MTFKSETLKVKNTPGTSDKVCVGGCISWKDHWLKNTGQYGVKCFVINCNGNFDVGGHVTRQDTGEVVIVPLCYKHTLCYKHNSQEFEDQIIEIRSYPLVSPAKSDFCGS